MILLFDIGNTNTHLGLANSRRVVKQADVPTAAWFNGTARKLVAQIRCRVAAGRRGPVQRGAARYTTRSPGRPAASGICLAWS